jgi:hypothetical protein
VTGLIAGGLSLLLGLNTLSAANELHRHSLADKDVAVAAELQQLHDEVAASSAPANLARAAESFGMVPAGNPAFLVIEPDGKVRLLGRPAPATAPPLPLPPKPKPKAKAKPKAKPKPTTTGTTSKKTTTTATKTVTPKPTHTTPPPPPTVTLPGGAR